MWPGIFQSFANHSGFKRWARSLPSLKKLKGHAHLRTDQPGQEQGDLSGPSHVLPLPVSQNSRLSQIFSNAHHFSVGKMAVYIHDSSKSHPANGTQQLVLRESGGRGSEGWDILVKHVAKSALLEAQPSDGPRCDDGTRVDVLQYIDAWLQQKTPSPPCEILCITAPAGCGKSALQRTTAEKCKGRGTLAGSFFFSSSDPWRNDASRFVSTLAYQLDASFKNPSIRSAIAQCVYADPGIFDAPLERQMEALVIKPLQQAIRTAAKWSGPYPWPRPDVMVIDGVDECGDSSQQTAVLKSLEHLRRSLSDVDFTLRIVVTGRPEWAVWKVAEGSGHRAAILHVKLADVYDATDDIRGYVKRRLSEIAASYPCLKVRYPTGQWPTEEDVETLVHNASGQFIYARVAIDYILERYAFSPDKTLQTVLSWTPADTASKHPTSRPFSPLDKLYTGILRNAQASYNMSVHHSGIHSVALFVRLHQFNGEGRFASVDGTRLSLDLGDFETFLGMQGETYHLISDMRSLLTIRENNHGSRNASKPGDEPAPEPAISEANSHIHFYHKSFLDFLDDPIRAGEMYVPHEDVALFLATCALQQVENIFDHDIEALIQEKNTASEPPTAQSSRLHVINFSLQLLVAALPDLLWITQAFIDALYAFTEAGGWEKLDAYVKATGTGSLFSPAFATVLTLYAASHVDESVKKVFATAQPANLMDIIGKHRRSWTSWTQASLV